MTTQPETTWVARLSIKKPGAMTQDEREVLAAWLLDHAVKFARDGANYVDKGTFHATRYAP